MKSHKKNPKEEWLVAEGEYEGCRIIVRQNGGVRSMVGADQYPFRVGVAVPFNSPQSDGMPGQDELPSLNRIEDMICDYFEERHTGVLCLVITTQGMREFIAYAENDDVVDLVDYLSQHSRPYSIQHYVERDKNWDVYKQWEL